MTRGRIHLLLVFATAFVAFLACRKAKRIESPPDKTDGEKTPWVGDTANPDFPDDFATEDPNGNSDADIGGDPGSGAGQLAEIRAVFTEEDLGKYLDLSKTITYKFQYIDKDQDGNIQFSGGKAEVLIQGLPVGKSGLLTLEVLENSVLRLKGEIADLSLKAGANDVPLQLKVVDDAGSGDDVASLVLQITIEGEEVDGDDSGSTNAGDTVSFEKDVKPLAENFCVRCHSAAATEAWWSNRKAAIGRRLVPGSTGEMPQNRSQEKESISAAERDVMAEFVKN